MLNLTGINLNSIANVAEKNNTHIPSSRASQRFDEVLGSVMNEDEIISNLSSFGLPINIRNTPRHVNSMSELSSGLTIAPNIIRKMAQDEEYLQEINSEIFDWFFVHVPAREREEKLRHGDNIEIIAGMSIDENGNIVKWSGARMKTGCEGDGEESDIWGVVYGKKTVSNTATYGSQLISHHDANVDASAFSALVGNVNLKLHRRED